MQACFHVCMHAGMRGPRHHPNHVQDVLACLHARATTVKHVRSPLHSEGGNCSTRTCGWARTTPKPPAARQHASGGVLGGSVVFGHAASLVFARRVEENAWRLGCATGWHARLVSERETVQEGGQWREMACTAIRAAAEGRRGSK
jgi:hypothetical protein